ncbi:MAG: zinc-binding dehydrogenase [Alphaproteobacteria bacterium]|nr:zinc-binding dehydrogenase [Alphaproteobacteria bacterium]
MAETVPHTMRAVRLKTYENRPSLEVREVPVPYPSAGQVLVRVAASPIHLDDVVFCRGLHGLKRALPTTPGFEGSGRVVAVGGGLVTRWLGGRRVAFAGHEDLDGCWAEYAVVDASRCLPLWESIDDEQGAMLLVDPITAFAMLDEVREHHHKGIVQTRPLGSVGRIVKRLGRRLGIPVVHVAGSVEEVAMLQALGAEIVLDATADDFDAQLRRATRAWQATALLDGVGSDLTGRLLAAMPDGAEALVYGLEPGNRVRVDLSELVYRRKSVRGFSFIERSRAQGTRGILAQLPRLSRRAEDLRTEVVRRIGLDEVPDAVVAWERSPTGGKTMVLPTLAPEEPARDA